MNSIRGLKKVNIRPLHIVVIILLLLTAFRYGIAIGTILKPFIIAAVVSYLLNPIVKVFEGKGIRRIFSVLIVYLIFISIIMLLSFVLVPKLIKEISALAANIPQYSSQMQELLKKFQDGYINSGLPESFKDILDENILMLQSMIITVLQNIANGIIEMFSQLFTILIVPVITFYMLKDMEYFKNQFIFILPKAQRMKSIVLLRDIDNVFGKYIRGQIIIASFVGILTTIALFLIKVKYAFILGIFAGIANIIPYFGPFIGIIPTILFALLDSTTKALYAAGAFILIQQLECGFLTPKIIGKSIGIHPVYVIMSLIAGGKLFGVIGLIMAVPALAAIKLTLRHVLRDKQEA
ncbi:MAG TPA: AI-2E family transporter [Bacillota bacterium]|nr:AI-2E family transporter [Bacillota bacterium]HPL52726.1 AI-2E family transporter [Bacillota bacterium]